MNRILTFLAEFITNTNDSGGMNTPLLIIVIVLLLSALTICIVISRHYKLYIHSNEKNSEVSILQENEVVLR